MTVAELLRLPWTWEGPYEVIEDGERHYELRVAELPEFFVAGHTPRDVRDESVGALSAFLASYADVGETPTLPSPRDTWIWLVASAEPHYPEQSQPAIETRRVELQPA